MGGAVCLCSTPFKLNENLHYILFLSRWNTFGGLIENVQMNFCPKDNEQRKAKKNKETKYKDRIKKEQTTPAAQGHKSQGRNCRGHK